MADGDGADRDGSGGSLIAVNLALGERRRPSPHEHTGPRDFAETPTVHRMAHAIEPEVSDRGGRLRGKRPLTHTRVRDDQRIHAHPISTRVAHSQVGGEMTRRPAVRDLVGIACSEKRLDVGAARNVQAAEDHLPLIHIERGSGTLRLRARSTAAQYSASNDCSSIIVSTALTVLRNRNEAGCRKCAAAPPLRRRAAARSLAPSRRYKPARHRCCARTPRRGTCRLATVRQIEVVGSRGRRPFAERRIRSRCNARKDTVR